MGLKTKRKSGKRKRRRRKKKKKKGKGKKIKKKKRKRTKRRKTKGRKRNAAKNWNRTLLWHKESLIGIGDRDHLGIGTSEIEMNVVMVIVKVRLPRGRRRMSNGLVSNLKEKEIKKMKECGDKIRNDKLYSDGEESREEISDDEEDNTSRSPRYRDERRDREERRHRIAVAKERKVEKLYSSEGEGDLH